MILIVKNHLLRIALFNSNNVNKHWRFLDSPIGYRECSIHKEHCTKAILSDLEVKNESVML